MLSEMAAEDTFYFVAFDTKQVGHNWVATLFGGVFFYTVIRAENMAFINAVAMGKKRTCPAVLL